MASSVAPATRRAFACAMLLVAFSYGLDLRAAGAAPDSASAEEQQKAQQAYEQGVLHFKSGHHAEAAKAFNASYEIVASPNSHLMFARALRDSGELGAAYEELSLTQKEASALAARLPKYAETAAAAEEESRDLLKRVSVLAITVNGDAEQARLFVGSRQVARERWGAVAVEPGAVEVSARFSDGRRVSRQAQATPGQIVNVELEVANQSAAGLVAPTESSLRSTSDIAEDVEPSARPLRPWAYTAGVVGVLGFAGFAVMGSMSRSTFDELEENCPNKRCPPERADQISDGERQQLWANVGLGVGIAGLAMGITLFVIDEARAGGQSSGRTMKLVARPGGAELSGRF